MKRIKGALRLWIYDTREQMRSMRDWLPERLDQPRIKAAIEACIYIFLSITAFSLGQMSVATEHPSVTLNSSHRVSEVQPLIISAAKNTSTTAEGKIVASKKGKRWHYTWCPGAATISDKNKRWFKTEAAAEQAGYTKASNCK
jgi:hypothetical protein